MIRGATEVLGRRGLHATAFSEVLALTGASRGSIYHHFPGGKAELVEAALDDFSARLDDSLRALHGRPAAAVHRQHHASQQQPVDGGQVDLSSGLFRRVRDAHARHEAELDRLLGSRERA